MIFKKINVFYKLQPIDFLIRYISVTINITQNDRLNSSYAIMALLLYKTGIIPQLEKNDIYKYTINVKAVKGSSYMGGRLQKIPMM